MMEQDFASLVKLHNPFLEPVLYMFEPEDISDMDIIKVVFNNPATIVWFADGDKVVVKAHGEDFDKEKGVAMAVMRKLYNTRAYFNKVMENAIDQNKVDEVENVAINIKNDANKEHKCNGNCNNCK